MASSTEKPTHENKLCFAVINNIPNDYHSADLRNYFSQFIERSGFDCFHFRHRPEKIQSSEGVPNSEQNQKLEVETLCRSKSSFCCVVRLDVDKVNELIRMYHRQHWLDRKGESIPRLCLITKLFVGDLGDQELQPVYRTRDEQKQADRERETFTRADLNKLPELHPPDIMPHGNVGTPTMIFLKFIRECRLPPIVIKKLGLSFPKTRTNKRYGNVPMDYGTNTLHNEQCELSVRTEKGHEIHSTRNSVLSTSTNTSSLKETDNQNQTVSSSSQQAKGGKRKHKRDKETKRRMAENIEEKMIEREKSEESEEDADGCEEWERHEALYDDPDNQERNKERLFEEKIELKWEKGGSGLVFYTDAQYWQEKEGDFDEQTADDWDVDMSAYYEDGAGDKDIRDYITIRQEQRRRDGIENTDRFTAGVSKKRRSLETQHDKRKIGRFEKHTKGFGRKLMEKKGWRDGVGLGRSEAGIPEALENDGQNPRDRSGFGYREGTPRIYKKIPTKTAQREVIISTIYDQPLETDPIEPLLRRQNHYKLKYRDEVLFQKSLEKTVSK